MMKKEITYVDQSDLSKEESVFFKLQGELLKKNFNKRHISVSLMDNKDDVYAYISNFIENRPYIKNIAFSDGVTLYQLNLFNWIKNNYKNGYTINQPLERSRTGHYAVYGENPKGPTNLPYNEWEEKNKLWYENTRQSLLSDLLIISANAITLNGEIVSIDGLGNRVSGMLFGPLHVLCIVGKNKISTNVESALNRIHNYVAPKTYIRHINKHYASFDNVPCVKLGKCVDCSHEYSSCRDVVVMRGQIKQHKDRLHLLVMNENLGF